MVSFHKQFAPILFGAGAVSQLYDQLASLGVTKALICTDKGVSAAGTIEKVTASLAENNFPFVVYDGCLPDAPHPTVLAAAELARAEKIDVIVAVGGGSNLDTAKAVSAMVKNEKTFEELIGLPPPGRYEPDVDLVLIPTTSGTGSEATFVAVLSDSNTSLKHGVCVTHASLSIVDPELAATMPPGLTATTGMDAIAHACEAYTTVGMKNPMADQHALAALRLAARWLPVAVKDGGNIEARTYMSLASTLGGMAFIESMCNFGHGIAHAFGSRDHLAHGLVCGLAEPATLESFAESFPNLIRDIGEALGAVIPAEATNEEIGKATGNTLRKLMKEIGIPTLKDLGFSREDVLDHNDVVMAEFQTHLAPITITPEIVEKVLASMYDDYI